MRNMYSHLYIMSRHLYMTTGNLCGWRSRAHHAGWAPESACSWLRNVRQRQPASVGVVTVADTVWARKQLGSLLRTARETRHRRFLKLKVEGKQKDPYPASEFEIRPINP
jgi:hypothetical protein